MSPSPTYPTRNYAIGELLLTLRSRAKLTQSELAAQIGLHRRTVQKWESGETYPTAENLRALINLLLTRGVLITGQERDKASDLWQQVSQQAPHPLPPFDKAWFEQLLSTQRVVEPPDPPATQVNAPAETHSPMRDLPDHLPSQPTPLVGREAELREVAKILGDPACRLLTLVGPGGVGKTRLALEVAARQAGAFSEGVALVPLDAIATPNQMVAAIGAALHLTFAGEPDPVAHLLNQLRPRHLLLLLDDFEHLLAHTDLVSSILQQAPRVTLLITSRERLNLQAEWLFHVEGLDYPPPDSYTSVTRHTVSPQKGADWAEYSAVQLFIQRAKQVQPEFPLHAATLKPIVHICQHVAGMPLAIELAAASVRNLPIGEIERQIRSNLNLLSTTLRDVPHRHRSLRAVFDHSWELLNAQERAILSRMAIFRGGWYPKAVEAICERITKQSGLSYKFSPATLGSLVDKSLVRQRPIEVQTLGNAAHSHLRQNPVFSCSNRSATLP